jgi:hypothetical protein
MSQWQVLSLNLMSSKYNLVLIRLDSNVSLRAPEFIWFGRSVNKELKYQTMYALCTYEFQLFTYICVSSYAHNYTLRISNAFYVEKVRKNVICKSCVC